MNHSALLCFCLCPEMALGQRAWLHGHGEPIGAASRESAVAPIIATDSWRRRAISIRRWWR